MLLGEGLPLKRGSHRGVLCFIRRFFAAVGFLVRPKAIACRADLSFSPDVLFIYLFLFEREISEMRGPTGVKFCRMVSTSTPALGETSPVNFGPVTLEI